MKKIYLFLVLCFITFVSFAARNTAVSGGGTAAGNITCSATNTVIYTFTLGQYGTTANAVLNGVTFTTTGTYVAADLTNIKLWYNTTNSMTGATNLGTLTTGLGPGTLAYTGLTQTLTSSGSATASTAIPYYFFITVTTPATTAGGHTIAVSAMPNANIDMSAGTLSGSATAGGTQTITPLGITGTTSVCAGLSTSLADATASGTWTSATTSVATINSSGVVFGVAAGTSLISYTVSGCRATATVTVSAAPASITTSGSTNICVGASSTFSDATGAGTWSVTAGTGTATVTTGGVVTGLTAGTVTLSYTTAGCNPATQALTVIASPTGVTATAAPNPVCSGATLTLTGAATGATVFAWSGPSFSATTQNTSLTATTGAAGIYTFTATNGTGCSTTAFTSAVAVGTPPASITGSSSACAGSSVTLTNTTSGGTWSVTAGTGTATITTGGVITGLTLGTVTVSYTTTGCTPATFPFTVNGVSAISFTTSASAVCAGTGTTITATGATTYSWSPATGLSASTGASVFANPSSPLVYTVTGTTSGCSAQATRLVAFATLPTMSPTATSPTTCIGGTSNLSAVASYPGSSSTTYAYMSIPYSTLATTGTAGPTGDDAGTNATIPFSFKFYGVNYTTLRICTNGWVCFNAGAGSTLYANYTIPSTSLASGWGTAGIALGLHDFTASANIKYSTQGTAPNRKFVVSYNGTADLSCGGTNTIQLILYETTNLIDVMIGGMTGTCNNTIGLQNVAGTDGVAVVNGVAGPLTSYANTGYRFYPYAFTYAWTPSGSLSSSTASSVVATVTGPVTYTVSATDTGSGCFGTATIHEDTGSITGTISGPGTVCPSSTANIYFSGPAGGTVRYHVASGAHTSVILDGTGHATVTSSPLTVNTTFTLDTVLSGSCIAAGRPSDTVKVRVICYCTPAWIDGGTAGYGCSDHMVVATTGYPFVLTGASGSISDASACVAAGYEDLTNAGFSVTLNAGNTYNATIGANTFVYTMNDQVWIDFNDNGTFESSEVVGGSSSWTTTTVSEPLSIPAGPSITSGTHRMRVETEYYYHHYPNLNPCPTATGTYYYGDARDYNVTIAALPLITAAGGATSICQGTTLSMSNATTGGTWSTSDATIVNINSSTGVATGGSTTGTATISYTAGGIVQTTSIANLAVPTPITGATTLCVGDNITLTEAVTGGTWSSSATARATVTSGGVVHGVAAGVTTISYSTGCGTPATLAVTVNALPGTTTATATSICTGATATLTNATSGGTWVTSDPTIASVNASTGLVTGIGGGSATITYSMGCVSTTTNTTMTINAAPAGITPLTTVDMCIGLTTTLSNTSSGGTWSSSATGIATVNATTGVVGGVSAGTATITYSNVCGAPATRDVNVNTPPNATITGTSPLCQLANTTLANTVSGGSWFSSNTSIATVDAVTGQVGGVAAGSATITYLISGCNPATRAMTVTAVPAAITGSTVLCPGTGTTLANTITGGTWSSGTTSVVTISGSGATATIGATSTPGTSVITYSNGCAPDATVTITVSGSAAPITGVFTLCAPSTTTLFTENWENGVPTVIGTPVDGWSALSTSNYPTYMSTISAGVNPTATAQSGTNFLQYNSFSIGSGNADLGSPSFSLSGITGATLTFWVYRDVSAYNTATYNLEGFTFYVNTTQAIAGATTLGYVPRRGGRTTSGTYLTGTATTATSGWYQYTCTMPATFTGATNYILISANSVDGDNCFLDNMVMTGTLGSSATLADATPGGTWSTSAAGVVTVNSSTGVIRSVSAGTATISYQAACGSAVTQPVTVTPVPGTFTGSTTICQGASATWTNSAGSGTWTSSDNTIASVDASSGSVTGIAGGTATITFANGCGIAATRAVTIKAVPASITGSTALCPGGTGTLFNAVTGGTWTSGTTSVATVNSTTGVVGAVASSGSTVITYTNGCAPDATVTLTVSGTPGAIGGPTSVCAPYTTVLLSEDWEAGVPTTLGSPVDGWSVLSTSNYPTYMSTVSSGSNPAATAQHGSTFLRYNSFSIGSGNADLGSPSFSLAGTPNVNFSVWVYRDCDNYNTATYNAEGFTFYINTTQSITGATSLGFVPRRGGRVISGSITGTSTTATSGWFQYTCALPAGFTGSSNYILISANSVDGDDCYLDNLVVSTSSAAITLTDPTPGGSWTSLSTGVATIGSSSGILTGVSSGSSVISYTTSCGAVGTVINVNPVPGTISGTTTICPGAVSNLTNPASGGTWATSNSAVASVNASTGAVTGVAAGTATISYSTSCGNAATTTVTVLAVPGAIAGSTNLCPSTSGTLSNVAASGTWTSSDPTIATINSTTGVIGATTTPGTTTVTYNNGCGSPASAVVTVSGSTAPIAGTTSACVPISNPTLLSQDWETPAGSAVPTGTTAVNGWAQLTNPVTNYFYTESSGPAPSASPQSGSYFLGYGYGTTPQTISSPSFSMAGISGATLKFYVYRDNTSFYNTTSYGNEGFTVRVNTSSSLTGATTIGFIPRAAALPVTGSYISGTSTTSTANWYLYTCTIPAAYTGSANYLLFTSVSQFGDYSYLDNITLTANPFTATLTDATPGGTWSSSNPTIASVNLTSGVVSGLSAGSANITYTGPCGSPVTQVVTINGVPGPISGTGSICVGASLTLSNSATGGTWTSGSTAIATVNPSTGMVTGVSAGSAIITYSNGCGTATTTSVTVKSAPASITGATSMCPSSSTGLSNTVTGGTWSSSNTSVASIGVFSGMLTSTATPGTTTITYTNGCSPDVTSVVNVSSSTDTIVGASSLCAVPTSLVLTSFENGVPTTSATPVDGWNYVQGTGAANSYWVSTAGSSTANPASGGTPSGGGTKVAQFSSKTITSGNTAALVSPSFDLTGGNGGKVSFYFYRDATAGVASNYDSVAVYINTSPVVGGSWIGSVCRSRTLSTAFTGTAVAAGWFKYTYTIPSTFTGTTNYVVLKGYSAAGNNMYLDSFTIRNNSGVTTLTDATSGGTWSTDAPGVATVNTVGVVTAVAAGTANISYTGACGAPVVHPMTVNPVPGSNTSGSTTICIGGTTTVANGLGGGTWASSNSSVATVDASGNVTGVGAGTASISYYLSCGNPSTTVVTVNALPLIASVTPSSTALCAGAALTLTSGAATGTGTFVSYNWSGPSSYSTTSTTTAVTYTVPNAAATGLYSLTVTYAGNGCTSLPAQTGTVTVNDYPTVYNVTGGNGCSAVAITVGLNNTQSSAITYSLILAPSTNVTTLSGTSSSLSFAPVNTSGRYIVKATSAVGCQSTMNGADTVVATPTVASITPSSTALCSGAVLTLTAGSVTASPTTYNWSGPGGYTATSAGNTNSLTVAPVATGIYTLTVNNGACYSSPVTSSSVTATAYPVVYNVTGGNGCTASGLTIGLDGSESTATYKLTMLPSTAIATVSGTSTTLSFSPVSVAGSYIVTATAGPAACLSTMNGNDTVTTTPSISLGTAPNVCQPLSSLSVSYSSALGSPNTYSIAWGSVATAASFAPVSGSSLGGSSIAISVPSTSAVGSFDGNITVSNSAGCGSSIYPVHFIVYANPTVTVTSVNVPCIGYAGSVDFTGTDSATVSYSVDGGSVNHFAFSGTTYNLGTGTITGAHTYILIGANNPVCSTAVNDTFTIDPTPMAWIGGTSGHETEWSSLTNWTCGFVPTVSDDVKIDAALYAPVVVSSDAAVVRNLLTTATSALSVSTGAELDVKGTLTNNGVISGSGKVMMNNSSAQMVRGIGTISNFDMDNSAGVTVDTGSRLMISKTLYVTSGTLHTNDSLELLSADTFTTARIATLPSSGSAISGKVKSDQFIQGGYRRYRFLSHPFSTAISLSQVNQYIDITGTGGAANGFQPTASNSASAFRLDPHTGNDTLGYDPAWKPFTKINGTADTNQFQPGQSIRIFMRGAKGEGLGYTGLYGMYVPSATTIQMIGTVNQGPVTVTMAKGSTNPDHQEFNMIGNPYASPVDIGTILYNAKVAGEITGSAFYVWDPTTVGGGSYTTVPLGISAPAPYYLPANSGFQVRADHDTAKLYFTESDKHATINNYLFKEPAQYVTLNVYDNSYNRWDMLRIQFNEAATAASDKKYDAPKALGSDFTFYSMTEEGRKMAIDARPYNADKVIPLGITTQYEQEFIIRADNIAVPEGGSVYLHDKLLDKVVDMKAGTEYKFTISKNKATQGDNRFELGLRPAAATANTFAVTMTPNPATDDVKITFTSGKKEQVSVRVMDMSGISIYNKDLGLQQNGTVSVPLSTFASGIYMVELTQGSQKVTQKLVKE